MGKQYIRVMAENGEQRKRLIECLPCTELNKKYGVELFHHKQDDGTYAITDKKTGIRLFNAPHLNRVMQMADKKLQIEKNHIIHKIESAYERYPKLDSLKEWVAVLI